VVLKIKIPISSENRKAVVQPVTRIGADIYIDILLLALGFHKCWGFFEHVK
jgi:hypothetical protein